MQQLGRRQEMWTFRQYWAPAATFLLLILQEKIHIEVSVLR